MQTAHHLNNGARVVDEIRELGPGRLELNQVSLKGELCFNRHYALYYVVTLSSGKVLSIKIQIKNKNASSRMRTVWGPP